MGDGSPEVKRGALEVLLEAYEHALPDVPESARAEFEEKIEELRRAISGLHEEELHMAKQAVRETKCPGCNGVLFRTVAGAPDGHPEGLDSGPKIEGDFLICPQCSAKHRFIREQHGGLTILRLADRSR